MQKIFGKPKSKKSMQHGDHWISMSDLMAGLMMVFLLISIAFMQYIKVERDKIKEVAVMYQNSQVALYEALQNEFEDDLSIWDADIDKHTLEFRFNSPEVLFDTGKIDLKPQFKEILNDFFPRYLMVISNFKDNIAEIRIEGHTSSAWGTSSTVEEAYFNNMELSQGRTRSVLQYVYLLPEIDSNRFWIKDKFAAVGYSSAHLVFDDSGKEDEEKSRRVSFKVMTNAENQIRKIVANE
ncbi:cell envelope biogenesis protein OmpA [Ignatzschineria sp. F8392]|uniref:OmpA/MotB family protein n=1 Tax=Ignatzschineria sp. F8392 TaxID=1980117 RepID=UPI000B999164|nr:OmpA family protein [Ignatzschineria sp. F8392]OYQ81824.1 cell envelope biogenesis protein OmpA [Ignatzschineria sp. F8392]